MAYLFTNEKDLHGRRGYTLIEVLVYMALFSLVIGGMLLTTYGILQNTARLEDKVVVNEDGGFLIRKIDWALTNATAVSCPASGQLQITKLGLPAGNNPLLFALSLNNVTLKRGSGSAVQLNGAAVSVKSLLFTCTAASGGKPASVRTQLALSSISATESFDNTKYLRQ